MPHRLPCIALAAVLCAACSDERPPADQGVFGSEAPESPCRTYCETIQNTGVDCADYNRQNHCIELCNIYEAGPCASQYHAFQRCMLNSSRIECYRPEGAYYTGLHVYECNSELDAWQECTAENDAGVCRF